MAHHNDRTHLTSRHRLRTFDYTLPGYYFLTITTHRFQHVFGVIEHRSMRNTPAGEMVNMLIRKIPQMFPTISVDCSVVMPNHVHLILHQDLGNAEVSPSDVVRWLKGQSLAGYRRGVNDEGWQPYSGKLWMDGFHDKVLRTDAQLANVRRYVAENPQRWDEDELRSMKDEGGLRRN